MDISSVCDAGNNFYAVLGVFKGCSTAEIRSAYRKLAMRWHPDKCANSDPVEAEKSKLKFQSIQEAYSVLADESKRFWYDAGFYRSEEDEVVDKEAEYEKYDMNDFLDEMQSIMRTVQHESKDSSFEDIKDLFQKIMDGDVCKSESVQPDRVPLSSHNQRDSKRKLDQVSTIFEGDIFEQVFGGILLDPFSTGAGSDRAAEKCSKAQKTSSRKRQKHSN